MIEFQQVKVERQGWPILVNLEFEVNRGEFVYLVGPTGSGKSTIIRLLLFQERPTRGVVFVGEYDSETIKESDIPYLRRRVGVVFQDVRLLRDRTVFDNVAIVMRVTGAKRSEIKNKTISLLSSVGLVHKRSLYPDSLSLGEKQLVSIARAMVNDPIVLLADEPTSNMDLETTDQMMEIFSKANARGTSVVLATHDISLVEKYRHRKLFLIDGRIQK